MKQDKYQLIRNGSLLLETDSLESFEREVERLKNRRTGKTTRMFFRALASDKDVVYIVCKNKPTLDYKEVMFTELLDRLKFDYTIVHNEIRQFGRKFRFITSEFYSSDRFSKSTDVLDSEFLFDD